MTQGIVSGSVTVPFVPSPLTNPLIDRPGAGVYRTRRLRIFSKLPIRETVEHDGRIMLRMLDTSNLFFEVINTHNEEVGVRLVVGGCGGYVGATDVGLPENVAANSSEGFTVAADASWGPWMGIQVSFTVAPTSGFLTVLMTQREFQPRER